MSETVHVRDYKVGLVGLGLMGSSIAVSLLLSDHLVVAIAPVPGEKELAPSRIRDQLALCEQHNLLQKPMDAYLSALIVSDDYAALRECDLVLECVTEDVNIKAQVYAHMVKAIRPEAIIGTNTSAIPISLLQQYVPHPERFIGIHWAEPAFATRFMEIVCGEKTGAQTATRVFEWAGLLGKEPSLLKKDIRGFITNRLMYAVYRETLALVEDGRTTLEDADKAFRYDAGSWMTMMGIFRRMDYLGLADYEAIFAHIFPALSNVDQIPPLMQKVMDMGRNGAQNRQGLYTYTRKEAQDWDRAFAAFNKDIYQLASFYPHEEAGPAF